MQGRSVNRPAIGKTTGRGSQVRKTTRPILVGLSATVLAGVLGGGRADAQSTSRASVSSQGVQGDGRSQAPSVSGDGRLVAFDSNAVNLVPADTNLRTDVFVRDLQSGTTLRVSVDSQGVEGNDSCYNPAISADGRFVAFDGLASNLVAGDTNGAVDVFVRDLQAGTTARVSVDSQGDETAGASVNSLSADGRFVVLQSTAGNLVPGDTNGLRDVFVHDRDADANGVFDEAGSVKTVRVSIASDGSQGDHESSAGNGGSACQSNVSANGRFVAFWSYASNLVPTDLNGQASDIFVHDRDADGDGVFDEPGGFSTTLVSMSTNGGQGETDSLFSSMSSDGRFVAFASVADNLDDLVASRDGRDIFVHDRDTDGNGVFGEPGGIATAQVSVDSMGVEGDNPNNYGSDYPSISGDGRFVVFTSECTNLVPNDTNGMWDTFVHDRQTGTTTRANTSTQGGQSGGDALFHYQLPSISASGRHVAFASEAADLLPAGADTNLVADIFVRDHGDRWTRQPDLPAAARLGAVGLVIQDKGYVLGGVAGPAGKVLWEYTPGLPDRWRRRADFPAVPRSHAAGFSIGTKLYVGTGLGSPFLRDLWEWDQATNQWSQKAALPGFGRYGAVGFAINGKGYIATGYGSSVGLLRELWEFTPDGGPGSWTRKADLLGPPRVHATGFSIGGSGFIGLGVGLNDLWEYVPGAPGTWLSRASFPGGARSLAVGFAMDERGYVGTGEARGKMKRDFWEYTPGIPGVWTRKADCGGPDRFAAIGFAIDGKGYLGTGVGAVPSGSPAGGRPAQATLLQRDWWKYTP